jgi:hypothetical protein
LKRLDKVAVVDQHRDARVASLEEGTTTFSSTLTEWRLEVDSSITSVKLKLFKLNEFFDCGAKGNPSTPRPGVLPIESVTTHPSGSAYSDGPARCRSNIHNRDCGFGRVFTQIDDPVTGMMIPPQPTPNSSPHALFPHSIENPKVPSSFNSTSRFSLGKLPKVNFPRFEGENLKLWQSRCGNYFEMYTVDPSV